MVTHPVMESDCKTALPVTTPGGGEHTELLGLAAQPGKGNEPGAEVPAGSYSALLPNGAGLYKKKTGIVSGAFAEEHSGMPPREGSEVTLQLDEDEEDKDPNDGPHESLRSIVLQVFFPFMCAGIGTVMAGLVLHHVQDTPVFQKVSEIMILVPSLLGLKGNLEMTLAARLSTQANLGNMESGRETWRMVCGNMALVQCQAIVVAFLAAVFAVVVDAVHAHTLDLDHATLLCACSLVTAALASVVLGVATVGIVIGAKRCHINPDNVATPVAASLGDVTTLALLAAIGSFLFNHLHSSPWLCPLLICVFVLLAAPLWAVLAHRNPYTRQVLFTGWVPVIGAVAISSVGGIILDQAVAKFHGLAVFQPVINGVGGNLAAVQASRISTFLHQVSSLGHLPAGPAGAVCVGPLAAFLGPHANARVARTLLLMALPGHLAFAYCIHLLNPELSLSPLFLFTYETSSLIQVFLLLYSTHCMINWMWRREIEPDNSAIPYLTALGDLLGTALLAVAFVLLDLAGDPIAALRPPASPDLLS